MKTIKRLFLGAAILAVIVPCGACKKKLAAPETARPVETANAVKKDVMVYIESFGNLYSPFNVDIKAQVTGEIKAVHFNDGDVVTKGSRLFTIDPSQYQATLDKQLAQLAQDKAELQFNQNTLDRNKTLLERELISRQDYDKYSTDVEAAKAQINLDNANVDLAKINLSYCYINSPLNGLCGKRQVDPGNIITANSGPSLVNIKSIDPLYIDFTIPERDLGTVRDAMAKSLLKVEIIPEVPNNMDKSRQASLLKPEFGELHFLDNAVDNVTGTIQLRAIVPNDDRRLWSGQFVRVHLHLATTKNAIVIPYQAVQMGQKNDKPFSYVYVVTPDKKVQLHEVITSSKVDDYTIVVSSGVAEGDTVVTSGQMGLHDGAPILEVPETPGAGADAGQ